MAFLGQKIFIWNTLNLSKWANGSINTNSKNFKPKNFLTCHHPSIVTNSNNYSHSPTLMTPPLCIGGWFTKTEQKTKKMSKPYPKKGFLILQFLQFAIRLEISSSLGSGRPRRGHKIRQTDKHFSPQA